jgi:hypothetical protein
MASKIDCICNVLEDIDGFQSIGEFERFQKFTNELAIEKELLEIHVRDQYFQGLEEQWYQCTKCSQIWRLVHPDYPFTGLWTKID